MSETARPHGVREQDELRVLVARHRATYEARFGPGPVRCFFSPGRVNLMGAHLDYNGGPVMPMALDRGTIIVLRERTDGRLNLSSTLEAESLSSRLDSLPAAPSGKWFDYPLGVVRHLCQEGSFGAGADLFFGGNLPIGAGLSSSASICVGTAFAMRTLWGLPPDAMACIGAALAGERQWVGVQCGIMDPYAVALSRPGHVLWLDCKDARYEHLPFDTQELLVAVADSGVRRELAKGDFNRRVSECQAALAGLRARGSSATLLCDVASDEVEAAAAELGPLLASRARHVVGEVARTRAARAALLRGDLVTFGQCINATHRSLRDLYQVSVPELDCLAESAQVFPGVLGARLTGAGFGGCVVVVVPRASSTGLAEHLQAEFERRFGRRPPVFFFRGDPGPREVA